MYHFFQKFSQYFFLNPNYRKKIHENHGKIFEKDTPFFEYFPKEIHRIANFESVSYRGPHQNHLLFPSVSYKGRFLFFFNFCLFFLFFYIFFSDFLKIFFWLFIFFLTFFKLTGRYMIAIEIFPNFQIVGLLPSLRFFMFRPFWNDPARRLTVWLGVCHRWWIILNGKIRKIIFERSKTFLIFFLKHFLKIL